MLGLHHTKKGGADDPLEALSGSNGLSACADTTLVLDSDQNGKTLYVRGRDVEEKETALIFAGGSWSVLGEAADVRRSDERIGIIATLTENGEPMTPAEIAAAAGKPAAQCPSIAVQDGESRRGAPRRERSILGRTVKPP